MKKYTMILIAVGIGVSLTYIPVNDVTLRFFSALLRGIR